MPQSGCRLWRRQNKSIEFTEDPESGVELSSVKTKDTGEDQLPGSMTRREKSGTFFHPCPQLSLPELTRVRCNLQSGGPMANPEP